MKEDNSNNKNDNLIEINTDKPENSVGKKYHKEMNDLIKKLTNMKKTTSDIDELIQFTKSSLLKINPKIHEIIDDSGNTLAHNLISEENFEYLFLIINAYFLLSDDKELFFDWLFLENNKNLSVLDYASEIGSKPLLEYLYKMISKTSINRFHFEKKKNTIFHSSAKKNQYFSILFWYDKLQKTLPSIKITDTYNKYHITPLQYACYHNSYSCVELLLDLNSDINAVDIDGKSVLTYAVYSNNEKLVKKLLIRGADQSLKDKKGKTAYDYAVNENKTQVINLLKKNNFFGEFIKKYFCFNFCRMTNNIAINKMRYDFELIMFSIFYFIFQLYFVLKIYDKLGQFIKNNYLIIIGISFCLSALFLIIVILTSSYFMCCIKHKQHLYKNKQNLLKIYEKNSNICVKCVRVKQNKTVHCLICNICIDDWDHHCFWLNTCITKNNKKTFLFLLISLLLLFLSNASFFISMILYSFNGDESDFLGHLFYIDINENFYRSVFIIFAYVFGYSFLYYLYFSCNNYCSCNSSNKKNSKEVPESIEESYNNLLVGENDSSLNISK